MLRIVCDACGKRIRDTGHSIHRKQEDGKIMDLHTRCAR